MPINVLDILSTRTVSFLFVKISIHLDGHDSKSLIQAGWPRSHGMGLAKVNWG